MRTLRILALAVLLPTAALAEREITPLVGYRQGTVELSTGIACVTVTGVDCPLFAKSEEAPTVGILADLPLTERLDVELLLNRQASEFFLHDGVRENPSGQRIDFDVTHLQAGLRAAWQVGRLEPFAAFGAGYSRLESGTLPAGSFSVYRPSASLAGGARARLTERLGLRLEARAYFVDLPDQFEPFVQRLSDEHWDQTELSAGLAVRF